MVLAFLGAVGGAAIGEAATVSFAPAAYRVAAGAADLEVTLAITAPECGAGEVEVLESTLTLRAAAGGTAAPGRDFRPLVEEVPLGGSRSRIPVLLRGLVLRDPARERTLTFLLAMDPLSGARVLCPASGRSFPLVAGGRAATVEIAGTPPANPGGRLAIAIVSGDGQAGTPGRRLPSDLVVRVSGPRGAAAAGVAVAWRVILGSAQLGPLDPATGGSGLARAGVTPGPAAGPVEVSASLPGGGGAVVFHLTSQGSSPPASSTGICLHPEGLPAALRQLCAGLPAGAPPPRQILPDGAAAEGTLGLAGLRLQRQLVTGRLDAYRSRQGRSDPSGGDGEPEATGRPSAFASAGTGAGDRSTSSREAGYDYALDDLMAGVDMETRGGVLLGASAGYGTGEGRYFEERGSLRVESACFTLYAAHQGGRNDPHWEGIFSWGRPRFAMARSLALTGQGAQTARSRATGIGWELDLGGGTGLDLGPLRLEGFGYGSWAQISVGSFTERGAGDFDLSVAAQRRQSLLACAGFRASWEKAFRAWGLGLHAGGSVLHEFADHGRRLRWQFAQGPDPKPELSVATDPSDRNSLDLEAGLTGRLPGPLAAYLNVHREVQHADLETTSLLAGFLWQF